VAENVGTTPATGLLFASRSVAVIVEVATPFAVIELVPVIVEFTAATAPATKLTVFVTPVRPVGAVILSVFVPMAVVLIVPVASPFTSVTVGWTRVFPVPVAPNVVAIPVIGLLFASRRVMVTVEVATPSAETPVLGEATIVEFAADARPGLKTTVPVTEPRPAGEAMLRVLVSAPVEAIVPLVCPEALVTDAGWTSELPVPVAAKVAVVPEIRLLFESRSVIVTVEVVVPSAETFVLGEAEIVEFVAEGAPAVKVTAVVAVLNPAGVAMLIVFASATVERTVPVACPDAFVVDPGCVRVFPVPVEANAVEAPLTGLLFASRRVIVRVEVVDPSAVTLVGEAEIVEFATTGVPATKLTVPPVMTSGVTSERVFTSARSDLSVQVETPDAFVAEHAP